MNGGIKDQSRWDNYGYKRYQEIRKNPDRFKGVRSPLERIVCCKSDLDVLLSSPKGKRILEIGCGMGELSVFLAKKGAEVTAIDIGPGLIKAAESLSKANKVKIKYLVANAAELPFEDEQFDCVICICVLHHLSQEDLRKAVSEFRRVLKKRGSLLLSEPIEESVVFDFLQDLVPIRNGLTGTTRPSILQRKKWKQFIASSDERTLAVSEIKAALSGYGETKYFFGGLTSRLDRILPNSRNFFESIDTFLLNNFPLLNRYSRNVVVLAKK